MATQSKKLAWDVVPLVPLSGRGRQTFAYEAPAHLGALAPGALVRIPFGRRTVRGIAWRERRSGRARRQLKAIHRILSPPLFAAEERETFERLAELSLVPLAALLKSAGLVRDPLRRAAGSKERAASAARRAFRVRVFWGLIEGALADVSPTGQTLVLIPELAIGEKVRRHLEQRQVPCALFAQSFRVGERRAVIERLVRGEPLAVVATHAGVFLPFPAPRSLSSREARRAKWDGEVGPVLERIIVLEAALASHRQWDLHPRYDARVAALLLAQERRVPLTFQSSLPSLDLAVLDGGNVSPSLLPAHYSLLPRKPFDPLLSPPILSVIRETTDRGGSVFLFHDIVGEERAFACDTCGTLLRCETCAGMLERSGQRLRCRACGADGGPVPHFCPRCQSPHIAARRIGTARLERELTRALPPGTRVIRADRETLPRRSDGRSLIPGPDAPASSVLLGSERALAAYHGTAVDRVVVLDADRILEEPRFDAAERWLVILGRLAALQRPGGSPPLLQTTHGSLAVVRALAEETFAVWLDRELSDRETLGYPPHAAILHLHRSFPVLARASAAARLLAAVLARQISPERVGVRVAGFAPRVRAEVLLRGSLEDLQKALSVVPSGWTVDPHIPLSLLLRHSER